jgi:hypothetical protein
VPDVFEGHAAQLVLAEVAGGDWFSARCAAARDQHLPAGGVRPGGTEAAGYAGDRLGVSVAGKIVDVIAEGAGRRCFRGGAVARGPETG